MADKDHDQDQEHEEHEVLERFERGWVWFSLGLVVIFTALIFYAIYTHGAHIAKAEPREPVDQIFEREAFANPGVRETEDGNIQVSMVAQAFAFLPGEVEVPAGEKIEFLLTSRDVLHGFQVLETGINVEMIPGEVARFEYRFDRPGEYPIICNQYCGSDHHNMLGKVVVTDPDETAEEDPAAEEEAEAPGWREQGEQVYQSQCQACHQSDGEGSGRAFPPLAEHVPQLLAVEGGREYLIDVTLYGLGGEIEVLGETYRGQMQGFSNLSDEEIAAMLNYTAHAWGNEEQLPEGFERYAPEEVESRRGQDLGAQDVNERRQELDLD